MVGPECDWTEDEEKEKDGGAWKLRCEASGLMQNGAEQRLLLEIGLCLLFSGSNVLVSARQDRGGAEREIPGRGTVKR